MSSFYQDASLVMIPSGYKTGKVYSAVPTDGTGDLVFTRSNDTATRVNSAGLIEKVRTNQIRNSTMVGAAAPSTLPTNWTLNSGGLTFTVIGTGTEDGYTYLDVNASGTAASSNARIGFDSSTQILGATGQYWTNSFYFKKVSETAAPDSYSMTIFENTAAGTLVLINNGSLPATTSLARYSYTILTSGGATVARVQPFVRFNLTALTSYNFTFRIAATQMETGDIATDYIPTTTAAVSVGPVANVPRLDYLNSTCPKLLLEPQRTNYQLYSENSSQWSTPADGLTVVYNTSETIDPSGYYGAEKVTSASGNKRMFNGLTNPSGALTMSAFVKKGTGDEFLLRTTSSSVLIQYNLTTLAVTATAGTGTITNYGNGWYRVTASTSSAIANEVARYQFPNADGEYMYFWGAMVENGAYPTSYIPTLAAAATRGEDAASKTGISSLIGQTQGTLFIEFELQTTNQDIVIMNIYNAATPANSIYFYVTVSNQLQAYSDNSGTQASILSGVLTQGRYKAAFAYKANDFSFYLNGSLVGVDTSGTVPTCNALRLENYAATPTYQEKTAVSQALLFKTRLSNNALASLTTL